MVQRQYLPIKRQFWTARFRSLIMVVDVQKVVVVRSKQYRGDSEWLETIELDLDKESLKT